MIDKNKKFTTFELLCMSKSLERNNNGFCENNFIDLFRDKNRLIKKSLIYQFKKIKFPFFIIKNNEEKILTTLPVYRAQRKLIMNLELFF